MKITRLAAPECKGGESPMWDAERGELHYIDNAGRKVHSYNPETGATRSLDMPAVITTLVLRRGGGAVVTLRSGIHLLDLDSGALELIDPLADPAVKAAIQRATFELLIGFQLTEDQLRYNVTR